MNSSKYPLILETPSATVIWASCGISYRIIVDVKFWANSNKGVLEGLGDSDSYRILPSMFIWRSTSSSFKFSQAMLWFMIRLKVDVWHSSHWQSASTNSSLIKMSHWAGFDASSSKLSGKGSEHENLAVCSIDDSFSFCLFEGGFSGVSVRKSLESSVKNEWYLKSSTQSFAFPLRHFEQIRLEFSIGSTSSYFWGTFGTKWEKWYQSSQIRHYIISHSSSSYFWQWQNL